MNRIESGEPDSAARKSVRSEAWGSFWHRLVGKRRQFLIDRRYQLRVGALSVTVVLVLLLLLNLSLYFSSLMSSATALRAAPELTRYIKAQDRTQLSLILLGSVVFLLGVFVVSILETHRTAGAAYNVNRHLREIERGRYGISLKLRHGDNLRELEASFNDMARALRERTLEDVRVLEALAGQTDRMAGGVAEAREIASQLRLAVEEKRRLLE